jgi:hypothetical protein
MVQLSFMEAALSAVFTGFEQGLSLLTLMPCHQRGIEPPGWH